jgi:hypothetical protein
MSISRINKSGITLTSSSSKLKSLLATSGLPGAPTGISASVISPTQINLSWETPTIGFPTSYTVVASPSQGSVSYSGTTANVTGLSPETTYTFFVVANNSNGGGLSTSSPPATTPVGTPGPVSGINATVISTTQINLSWTAPTTGDPATTYNITRSPNHGSVSVSGVTATVTGLTQGTTYTFGISGANAFGTGPSTNSSPATTPAWNAASGGTTSTVSNYNSTGQTWKVHEFTSNASLVVTANPQPFRLYVGGGNGGGQSSGCCGSCAQRASYGGQYVNDSQTLSVATNSAVIGGGGAGGGWRGHPPAGGGGGGTSSFAGIGVGGGAGGPSSSGSFTTTNIRGSGNQQVGNQGWSGACGDGHNGTAGIAGRVIVAYRVG